MGMFDTYGNSQNRAGDCVLAQYKVGDKVPIAEGIYLGSNGFIVVADGVFVTELKYLFDYFGENPITAADLDNNYPSLDRQ